LGASLVPSTHEAAARLRTPVREHIQTGLERPNTLVRVRANRAMCEADDGTQCLASKQRDHSSAKLQEAGCAAAEISATKHS
jgi:hypothetical protein